VSLTLSEISLSACEGRFMANIFVHFEPVGKLGEEPTPEGGLPPYIIPGAFSLN